MNKRQDRPADYVRLMHKAAIQASSYCAGLSLAEFLADSKTQDAVVMKLLVIGELAAQMLAEHADFVGAHGEIPWQQMKGMRNRMAHGYFELNMEIVWETLQTAIPDLATKLQRLTT